MTGNKDVGVLSVSRCETPPKQAWVPPSYEAEGGHSTHTNIFIALTQI